MQDLFQAGNFMCEINIRELYNVRKNIFLLIFNMYSSNVQAKIFINQEVRIKNCWYSLWGGGDPLQDQNLTLLAKFPEFAFVFL